MSNLKGVNPQEKREHMIKKIRPLIVFTFCCFYSILFNPPSFAQTTNDNVCTEVQCVKIQNSYLWVLSSDNVTYVPYFVKAVGYQPTPIGRYPSDWGYPSTDPRSIINNNIYDDPNILIRDFSLLQRMNANTIRVWSGSNRKVSCECTNNERFPDYITNASTTTNVPTTNNTLDLALSYGLKVIAGFWVNPLTFDTKNNIGSTDSNGNPLSRQDIINNFVSYINTFKGNRAILFWAIGNENNYQMLNSGIVSITPFEKAFGLSYGDAIFNWLQQTGNFLDFDSGIIVNLNSPAIINELKKQYPVDYNLILNILKKYSGKKLNPQQLTAWYSLVDAMAQAAHKAEGATFHPVAVVNGGIAEIGNSTDGATDSRLPNLDIWGANVYVGKNLGTLFSDYAAKSHKPLWISEFGVDAWVVTNATGINDWGSTLTVDLGGTGQYDPATQSTWDVAIWGQIFDHLGVTIGGSLMEYSDEWWKPYEFYCTNPNDSQYNNAISAGICNSNQKYFGNPYPYYPYPGGFESQEWFGIMSISPNPVVGGPDIMSPRAVYYDLETKWQVNPWANITLNVTGSGNGTIKSSSSSLGGGLNCTFLSGSSTGICSAAFLLNQPVTLRFTSNNNSIITNWGVAGCARGMTICKVTPDTYININVTITATYTITASAGQGGTIKPSGAIIVNYGASQKFTVRPNAGYTASLMVDGKAVTLTNNTYTFSDVTATHTIAASFTKV